MKKSALLAVVCLFALGCAAYAADVHITVAHGATEDHSSHEGWLKFKEIIEAESNGAMEVEIFPNQQLGGDREVVEGCQLGNVQVGHSSGSPIAGFASEFYVLDAPFLFSTREEAYATLDGEPGKMLLAAMEKINLKGLGYTENGFRQLTANKKILKPEDLAGIKLRVMENKIQMATWRTLGANPTPVSFGELFTALQQRTVDAQENPFELIYTNKFFEVQNYVMTTNHIYTPMPIFMNLEFYNELTPEQQAIVHKAAKESIDFQRGVARANEEKAIEAIKGGIEIVDLTPEQRKLFRDKMGPVYDMVRAEVKNDQIMDAFLK